MQTLTSCFDSGRECAKSPTAIHNWTRRKSLYHFETAHKIETTYPRLTRWLISCSQFAFVINAPDLLSFIDYFFTKKVESIRGRLLERSFNYYSESVDAIEQLPSPSRAPMRVAVESYMQIARELQTPGYKVKAGRATVPKWKRIWVAWRALVGPREKGSST